MLQLSRTARGTALLALTAALIVTAPASAHVERSSGAYRVELGWGNEPAIAGTENFVQVELTGAGGAAIVVPAGALSAEVSYGGRAKTVPLVPTEEPGELRGALTPTLPGTYTFAIGGSGMLSKIVVTAPNGNERPDVSVDNSEPSVTQGGKATVTGFYKDPDGDAVSLSSSLGSVADNGNGTFATDGAKRNSKRASTTFTIR